MSLVKRDEFSLREFIVSRQAWLEGINFSLKGEYKKAVKQPYEGKGLSADEFY